MQNISEEGKKEIERLRKKYVVSEEELKEIETHKKWKKILRGITLEDAIRCEGFNEDFKEGVLSAKELEEEIYQISRKYS